MSSGTGRGGSIGWQFYPAEGRMSQARGVIHAQAPPIGLKDPVGFGTQVVVPREIAVGIGNVIGAGAGVTQDVPPRGLAVGVAARVTRPPSAGRCLRARRRV
jgi:acetyltransferase-like isoleucine patch superfamily enzyme